MWNALFADNAAWFAVPAIAGTAVVVINMILMLIGADGADLDLGIDAPGDSTHAFQILSVMSLSAFAMGFGWAGIAGLHGMGWSWIVSAAVGVLCGVAMMYIVALSLKGMHDMQSSGNLSLDSAMGAEGSVYLSVPEEGAGRGQVRIVSGDRGRLLQAVSEEGPIPTGARVRIVRVNADNTVTVARS
jgi:hypothetical protein